MPVLSELYKDENRIDYLSLLEVFSGPGYMKISKHKSQSLYTNAYTKSRKATSFSNTTKVSVSTVIKAFDIGVENETSYAESFESEKELRQITNNSSSEALETSQTLKDNQYGVVLCKTAMLNSSGGVVHLPVQVYKDVVSKDGLANLSESYFVDDSFGTLLAEHKVSIENLKTPKQLTKICQSLTEMKSVESEKRTYVGDIYCTAKDAHSNPKDMVVEHYDKSSDVNKGYGGKYTYVIKKPTNDVSQAATGFKFVQSENAKDRYGGDYASGAGGKYRYIICKRDGTSPIEWDNVKLFRGENSVPQGWSSTTDLNQGRGGDYLYLGWK